jgi:hypothetical protein
MGASIDAHLFYGYIWDDEDDYGKIACAIHGVDEDDYEPGEHSLSDWADVIHERRGHPNPWVDFPNDAPQATTDAWVAANREAIDRKFAELKAIKDEFGVSLDWHGHHECQAPHLLISGTKRTASGTDGLGVTAADLWVNPDWRDRLDKWLAEFGIEAPQPEPQWWIVAEYG